MPINTRQYTNKFNRGEVDPLALGRDDVVKINASAALMENFIPERLGAMSYRPGTELLGSTFATVKEIPFVAATDDTALMEFSNGALRIWVDDELITRTAVTTTITNGDFTTNLSGWTNGDGVGASSTWVSGSLNLSGNGTNKALLFQTLTTDTGNEHGMTFTISRAPVLVQIGTSGSGSSEIFGGTLNPGVHKLAFTPDSNITITLSSDLTYDARVDSVEIDGAGVMSIPQPVVTADLATIRHTQSADVVFCAAQNSKQFVVERRGIKSWSVVDYRYVDGPFNSINNTNITLEPSGFEGDRFLTASESYFKSTDVGTLFKVVSAGQARQTTVAAEDSGTGSVRVTGVGTSRDLDIVISSLSGTGTTVTLQQSTDDATWVDIQTYTSNTTTTYNDTLDNSVLFYRLFVKIGDYSTGNILLTLTYLGGASEGIGRVTSFSSSTLVGVQVLTPFGGTDATKDWYRGSWSETDNKRPTATSLYEGRLWWAGQNKVWGSVSDAYYSFDAGLEGNSASIQRTIGFGPVDEISWLMPANRLLMGISSDEIAVRSSSFGEILTPTNANVRTGSSQGSAPIDPASVNSRGYFVQRSLKKIYELQYSIEQDIHDARDLMAVNPSICAAGIKRIGVTMQPETRIWVLLEDGTMRIYLMDKSEDVTAWSRYSTPGGTIEDIAVLPSLDEDRVYITVTRGGTTYLEKLALFEEAQGGNISKTLDSFVQYTSPGTTLTGLSHLNGNTIGVWADGQFRGEFTVSGGSATVGSSWTNVTAGMRYTADYETVKLSRYVPGSVINMFKRVVNVGFLMLNYWPGSLKVGPSASLLDDFPTTEDGAAPGMTATLAEYDETPFPFNGTNDPDARIYLQANNPCTILAMTYAIEEYVDPPDTRPRSD